jgi:hypothetical protein
VKPIKLRHGEPISGNKEAAAREHIRHQGACAILGKSLGVDNFNVKTALHTDAEHSYKRAALAVNFTRLAKKHWIKVTLLANKRTRGCLANAFSTFNEAKLEHIIVSRHACVIFGGYHSAIIFDFGNSGKFYVVKKHSDTSKLVLPLHHTIKK